MTVQTKLLFVYEKLTYVLSYVCRDACHSQPLSGNAHAMVAVGERERTIELFSYESIELRWFSGANHFDFLWHLTCTRQQYWIQHLLVKFIETEAFACFVASFYFFIRPIRWSTTASSTTKSMRLAYITPFGQMDTCLRESQIEIECRLHALFFCLKSHSVKFRKSPHLALAFAISFGFDFRVQNAGHAIDRLQPINKMNARIPVSVTAMRSSLNWPNMESHTRREQSLHRRLLHCRRRRLRFIHVCEEKFLLDLHYDSVFVFDVRRRVSSAVRAPLTQRCAPISEHGIPFL